MINQDLQAALAELQEFIDDRPDAREVRKALAVKLVYQGSFSLSPHLQRLGKSRGKYCVVM